jgi:hypothetical protein
VTTTAATRTAKIPITISNLMSVKDFWSDMGINTKCKNQNEK